MLLLMTWKGSIGLKRALVGLQISSFVVLWRFVVDRFVWAFVPVEWLALLWSELSLLGRVESLSEQGAWRAGQWAEWVGLRVCLRSRTTRQTSTLALANNTTRAASRADDWIHTRPNPLKKDWRKKWEKKAAREGKAEETEAAGSYSKAREKKVRLSACVVVWRYSERFGLDRSPSPRSPARAATLDQTQRQSQTETAFLRDGQLSSYSQLQIVPLLFSITPVSPERWTQPASTSADRRTVYHKFYFFANNIFFKVFNDFYSDNFAMKLKTGKS